MRMFFWNARRLPDYCKYTVRKLTMPGGLTKIICQMGRFPLDFTKDTVHGLNWVWRLSSNGSFQNQKRRFFMSKVELKEISRPAPSFYRIYGRDLAIAVRVTFPGDAVIRPTDERFKFPELINPSPEIHLTREERRYTDLPAMADVDMSLDGKEE